MDNLELIEAYFNGELAQENKSDFDRRVISDPTFAEEVAFYLSSKQAAAAELGENRSRLAELYKQQKQSNFASSGRQAPLRKLWPWVAAAAVLAGIILGWYIFFQPVSPVELADRYIKENFQNLSVKMGGREDSLQTALRFYNAGRPEEAFKQFESLALRDSTFSDAIKYAGIVSLRLGQYDKAISYFSKLENYQLYANPGKFYHALTLLKRNHPGDKQQAKVLLEQVAQNDLAEKATAQKWLRKW